jgi:NAD-reducing hydrogenase small subunit
MPGKNYEMAREIIPMSSLRLATVWLSGCSGCHMSLLNLHRGLLEMPTQCDLVYSPLMDIKEYPGGVDIVLVEGAVANDDNREMAEMLRRQTRFVISLGDCAVHGNVSALRNPLDLNSTLQRSYGSDPEFQRECRLLPKVLPLHQVIQVDAYIPGCPPDPESIRRELSDVQERLTGFIDPQQ